MRGGGASFALINFAAPFILVAKLLMYVGLFRLLMAVKPVTDVVPNKSRDRAQSNVNPGVTILDDELALILRDKEQTTEIEVLDGARLIVSIGFDNTSSRYYLSTNHVGSGKLDKKEYLNISMLRDDLFKLYKLKAESFVTR